MSVPAVARWMDRSPTPYAGFWSCCVSVLPYNNLRTINQITKFLHDDSHSHRLAVAGGLLFVSVPVWTVAIWSYRGGRASLRTGSARNAGATRLGRSYARRPPVARKASALLLAGHAGLQSIRRERLGRAAAFGV